MISVLILTFNEESNISACLKAVQWSDDVLVLDSFSTDKTVDIVRNHNVRILQNRFVNFATQRNYGIEHGGLKHDWVLHLDADEIVTEDFKRELLEKIQSNQADAYRVPSKMMFGGRWLKYSGMYPTYQVRVGRRTQLKFVQVGHGQRESPSIGPLGTFQQALLHYSFSKGIFDWLARHNRYSSDEAAEAIGGYAQFKWADLLALEPVKRRRALKCLSVRLPCRPALRFFYMFFLKRGFLDGLPGYHYCCLLAFYEYLIVLKTRENQGQLKIRP